MEKKKRVGKEIRTFDEAEGWMDGWKAGLYFLNLA